MSVQVFVIQVQVSILLHGCFRVTLWGESSGIDPTLTLTSSPTCLLGGAVSENTQPPGSSIQTTHLPSVLKASRMCMAAPSVCLIKQRMLNGGNAVVEVEEKGALVVSVIPALPKASDCPGKRPKTSAIPCVSTIFHPKCHPVVVCSVQRGGPTSSAPPLTS